MPKIPPTPPRPFRVLQTEADIEERLRRDREEIKTDLAREQSDHKIEVNATVQAMAHFFHQAQQESRARDEKHDAFNAEQAAFNAEQAEINRAFAKGLALVANALGIGSQLPTTLKQSLPPPPMGRPESTPLLPQIQRAATENRTAGIIAMVILILQVVLHVVQILTPHP